MFSPTQVLDSFHLFSIMFSHVLWETFKATHSSWNLTMATSDHCWNKGAQVSRVESCTLYKGNKKQWGSLFLGLVLLFSAQPRLSMWDWPTSHFATCYICSITKHQAFLIFFNFQFSRVLLHYSPVLLISWGCLTSPTFFFGVAISQFDWPIETKSWNYGGSPKTEVSLERWSASPFGPPIYVRRGRTLGTAYWIKARCYWEHPLGTHWELEGNMFR